MSKPLSCKILTLVKNNCLSVLHIGMATLCTVLNVRVGSLHKDLGTTYTTGRIAHCSSISRFLYLILSVSSWVYLYGAATLVSTWCKVSSQSFPPFDCENQKEQMFRNVLHFISREWMTVYIAKNILTHLYDNDI